MEETQQYVNMAKQAGEEKAHVAVAMYYRTATELATSKQELTKILESVIEYAEGLKKSTDQLAIYQWEQEVIAAKLQGEPLENLVQQLIEQIKSDADKNATT